MFAFRLRRGLKHEIIFSMYYRRHTAQHYLLFIDRVPGQYFHKYVKKNLVEIEELLLFELN